MANFEKRTTREGKTVHRVRIRLKGYPTETATFDRLTDAKKWAASTESSIREGRHFKTSEAKRRTLGEMIDRYIRDVLPKKSEIMQYDQDRHLRWWKEQIGEKSLADVTSPLLAEYRDKLGKGSRREDGTFKSRSPATVVRYMAALSHAFTIAMQEWQWVDDTPTRKVKKPKEPRGRVRFLSDEEREKLLEACENSKEAFLYPIVVLALSTGARKSEILNLTWGDIDLKRKVAVLQHTKNDERRALPLSGEALKCVKSLAEMRRIDTRLLFPDESGTKPILIRAPWQKVLKEAGVEDFKFHDLRHSAASYLAMSGASLAEIAEVLGHKTLQMVKRYSHLSEQHTASVVSKMNEKIFGNR
jgi:integrase|tara:strand:+ start:98 stop:1174 length:1077 start_codon:yes stop_codon:yes gene_type:complete